MVYVEKFRMAPLSFFVLSSFAHLLLLSSAEEQKHHSACPPFLCGNLGEIRTPFRNNNSSECGLYTIDCSGPVPKIQLKERGHWYEIYDISPLGDSITIESGVGQGHFDPSSCKFNDGFALPSPPMISNLSMPNLLPISNCSQSPHIPPPKEFDHTRCGNDFYYAVSNISLLSIPRCLTIQLPGYKNIHDHQISSLPSFDLEGNVSLPCRHCYYRSGHCHFMGQDEIDCLNEEGKRFQTKKEDKKGPKKLELHLVLGTSSGIVVLILLFCCMWKFHFASHIWKKQSPTERNIEVLLKHYGPPQARRYSYLDVKKTTNSFKEKLGQGGFGSVYKGKLHDGSLVAVKVLDEPKANGEEFVNEVAAISRTSHVNIVSLLGFCFEGAKRALIYEFMVNGSLEKFVFDENANVNGHQLDWETHYQISLGIARGLEYLHRGCNTRILHFDIKPHNILLDADFVPKISDFGLARICTRKESLISMLGPRGTVGYIAPEVFSRNFGGISHKADVYSYGMMVLEMVGGRKNVNVRAGNTSEIYFPHWIYKRLELDEELGLKRIMNQEDGVKARKMIIVSLWCIQTDPSHRPAMSRVIEMLEGSLDSLQVPPKPFLSSPSGSPPAEFSSTF